MIDRMVKSSLIFGPKDVMAYLAVRDGVLYRVTHTPGN